MSENDEQQGADLETPDPRVKRPNVTFEGAEPWKIEIEASTLDGTAWYTQGYRFEVDGTTARLVTIDTADDTAYDVTGTEATREAVAERVQDLPLIDRVILFDGVRRVGPALEYSDDGFENVEAADE